MAHRIEAAKSGRAKCATCEQAIAKADVRVAEQYDDPEVPRPIHRFHHLDCALTSVSHVVVQALASPIDGDVTIDRAQIERKLAAELEAQRERRRERYAAQLAFQPATPAEATDVPDELAGELLAQLEQNPDDLGVLGVVADLLQSRNEPRGELIAVQLALLAGPRDPARLVRKRDELILKLSPALEVLERCAWGIGFVRRVELQVGTSARLARLARLWRHPSMRLVTEVEIGLGIAYPGFPEAIAPVRANLRRLVLHTHQRLGALSQLVATLPRLRQLGTLDAADFERLAHPGLERLTITSQAVTQIHEIVPRLSRAALPALRGLGLHATETRTDDVCIALRETDWLPRLDRLALVGGTLTERGIRALADGLGAHKLERLDVTGNAMPLTLRGALAELCEELVFPDPLAPDGPVYVDHANKPEWGTGLLLRRYDGKLEVEFPHAGKKVFKADAPFLKLRA